MSTSSLNSDMESGLWGEISSLCHLCHVVAIPYPGRGHINPMLNLCRLLAARNILISFIVTEEWLNLLGTSSAPFPYNLRLCTIPNVIPSEKTRGTDPASFVRAVYTKMEAPVEELIQRLEPPVDYIITSSVLTRVADIGKRRNIPVSSLWTDSPSVFLAFHQFDTDSIQDTLSGRNNEALAYLPRISPSHFSDIASSDSSKTIIRQYKQAFSWFTKSQGLLFTSFYELDSRVIDTLRSSFRVPIYPLGPSIPYMTPKNTTDSTLKWLDSQPIRSVLYIALGSFVPISGNQITEMATGLQRSSVLFLWVAREDTERVQEQCGGTGLVVPWCDQLRVLCHPSIGGFLTHCGWNSILEGVFAGVPMLTFPLIWDQYPNSKLVVDDWKVGLRLKDENAREGVVASEEIEKVVKELMEVESSMEVRKRAEVVKDRCHKALEEGGSLSRTLDGFVQGIVANR